MLSKGLIILHSMNLNYSYWFVLEHHMVSLFLLLTLLDIDQKVLLGEALALGGTDRVILK